MSQPAQIEGEAPLAVGGGHFNQWWQSRLGGHRGGRARLSRLLGWLYTRASTQTTHERQGTAGILFSDHQVRGWEQTDHTRDGEDAGGGCHTTPPPAWVGAFWYDRS